MRTAEIIVNEYLARGYSVESLRVLAESRPEPLCTEMLAILHTIREQQAGARDAADGAGADDGAEQVFFVAGDEESVAGEIAVDFDIMADGSLAPAGREASTSCEESVTDIFIGESEGVEMLTFKSGVPEGMADNGVWSRRWHEDGEAPGASDSDSGQPEAPAMEEVASSADILAELETERDAGTADADSSGPAAAESSSANPVAIGAGIVGTPEAAAPASLSVEEHAAPRESVIAMYGSDLVDPLAEDSGPSLDKADAAAFVGASGAGDNIGTTDDISDSVETVNKSVTENPMTELPAVESAESAAAEPAAHAEPAVEPAAEPIATASAQPVAERPADNGAADAKAASGAGEESDYLPGTATFSLEKDVAEPEAAKSKLLEAKAVLDRMAAAMTQGAMAPVAQSEVPAAEPLEAAPESAEGEEKLTRKERRRRERQEKKKRKGSRQSESESRDEGEGSARPETVAAPAEAPAAADEAMAGINGDAPVAGQLSHEREETAAKPSPGASTEAGEESPRASEPALAGEPELAEYAESEAAGTVESPEAESADFAEPSTPSEAAETADLPEASDNAESLVASAVASGDAGDHLMIIANGGLDLRSDAYRLLGDAGEEVTDSEPAESSAGGGHHVILFRGTPSFAEVEEDGEEMAEDAGPRLRMLAPDEQLEPESESEAASLSDFPAAPAAGAELTPMSRLELLRALNGASPHAEWDEPEASDLAGTAPDSEHVVAAVEPEPEPEPEVVDTAAAVAAAQAELEREYQTRLDKFAERVLDAQSALASSENRVKSAKAELAEKEMAAASLRSELVERERRLKGMERKLSETEAEGVRKDQTIAEFLGIREEHERLYAEFEDLRRGYNELVTDVLPNLQNERDDLALTVERQVGEEEGLRSSLGSARRRLSVGYSLGAAACLMLIGLPIHNWVKSDADSKRLAVSHQQATELIQRLERSEKQNIEAGKALVDIRYKLDKEKAELQKVKARNTELTKLADQRTREVAALRNAGTPTRASAMALSGPVNPDGRLQRNDVRDPGRQIDQVVARNREIYGQDNGLPAARGTTNNVRIPVSAVADARGHSQAPAQSQSSGLRPAAVETAAAPARPAEVRAGQGETLAAVQAGEGVAQVVYRVLGTRDPEVVNWVIRENNIKTDKRGNPRIYPEQKLRLPQDGRTGQAASAAGRR